MSNDRTCHVCGTDTAEVYCPTCGFDSSGGRLPFGDLSEQEREDVTRLLALAIHRQGVWQAHADEAARFKAMGASPPPLDPQKYDFAIGLFTGPIERLKAVLWRSGASPPASPPPPT